MAGLMTWRTAHQEGVYAHTGIDRHFAAEIIFKLLFPHAIGGIVREQLCEALHTCATCIRLAVSEGILAVQFGIHPRVVYPP